MTPTHTPDFRPERSNPEAERAVISAMCWQASAADIVLAALDVTDFEHDTCRRMFRAAQALRARNLPIDVSSLCASLRELDLLGGIDGGIAAVTRVLDETPAIGSVEAWCAVVQNHTRLRGFVREARALIEDAHATRDPAVFLDDAEARILAATGERRQQTAEWIGDLVQAEAKRLDRVRRGEALPSGVPYGFVSLDAMTGGMRPGEVTVIAGRPGMGKTALGVNVAVNVARSNHGGVVRGVLFASLEMSSRQLVRRSIAGHARAEMRRIEDGRETDEEYGRFVATVNDFTALPIKVDETTRMRPSQLRAQIRRMQSEFNKPKGPSGRPQEMAAFVVDYVQRMGADERRRDRFAEVSDLMNAVADTAKESGTHGLVLAQLNRENVKATGEGKARRPRMSDLADSGEIEKAAHVIALLHRPEYYVQDKRDVPEGARELAELIIDKQREGRTGIVRLKFLGEHTLFSDPSEDDLRRWDTGGEQPRRRSRYLGGGSTFADRSAGGES